MIPLAVLLIYFAAIRWKDHVGKVALPLILFLIAFSVSSLFGANKYIPFLNGYKALQMAMDDIYSGSENFLDKENLIIYTPKDFGTLNPYDYLKYYAPNHKTYQLENFEIPAEINRSENLTLMAYGYGELPSLPEGWTAKKVVHRDIRRQENFSYFLLSVKPTP